MSDYALVQMKQPQHVLRVTIQRPTGVETDMSAVWKVEFAVKTQADIAVWETFLISAAATSVVADRYLTSTDFKLPGEAVLVPILFFPGTVMQGDPVQFWVYE